jgi:pimeloyl-ACP methyl ester carboxylesterase
MFGNYNMRAYSLLFMLLAGNCGASDAFYDWPEPVPETPGKLLRSEALAPQESLSEAAQNVRILYSSTDGIANHGPITVSGALFLPKGNPPVGGWPLMAWAHGTVGSADVCAPSRNERSPRDTSYLNYWLSQGYAIVATDYQGLGTPGLHPFGLSRPLAYGVLDSIRAVAHANFQLSEKVVVFGQSQGGRAAFATSVYAKKYAPDIQIVGVVATGTPYASKRPLGDKSERESSRRSVVPTFAYDLLRLSTATLLNPSFIPTDYISERATAALVASQQECLHAIERIVVTDQLTFENSFKRSPTAALNQVYRASAYPSLKTDIPIFMGTGGKDRDVFVPDQKALVKDACAAGDRIEWHFYPDLDHSATVNGSLGDSTGFVRRAFQGEVLQGNCKI